MAESPFLELVLKVAAAVVLGGLIGWQREIHHKPAGFRTHILIVLGSTVVMDTSHFIGGLFGGDPTRLASNVIVGIGFIGAGTIMKEGPTVYGLTTAATIWVAGALGLAIGAGYYTLALLLTAATLCVLIGFVKFETLMTRRHVVRHYTVRSDEEEKVVARIQQALAQSRGRPGILEYLREEGGVQLAFEIHDTPERQAALFEDLRRMREVRAVRTR